MSKNPPAVDPSCVERTPTVWFMRLEDAVNNRDVRQVLQAGQRLLDLGFEVNLRSDRDGRRS